VSADLDGRTAVVTGAGQGVGRGIALALSGAGASVVVAARRASTGEPVAEEIRGRGGRAVCIPTDVTDRAAVAACVDETVGLFGGLDVMVHNAFRGGVPHRLEEATDELWAQNSRTAVWGSFLCAQIAHPHLRASGHGRLVLLTSPSGVEGSANIPLYSPVKGAQRAIAKSLAREWGADGITVNCIAPVAETPSLTNAFAQNPDLKRRMEARTPLGRVGDAERDIGAVAVFLASDAAGYVTGQTVVCDGGSFTGL
jgi:NAD(P)-dependent dehydrogenase (short-subunit alcohol dehydrogenase family)